MTYALAFILFGIAGLFRGGFLSARLGIPDEKFPDKGAGTLLVFITIVFVSLVAGAQTQILLETDQFGMNQVFLDLPWKTAFIESSWQTAGWYIAFSMGAWEMCLDLIFGRDPRKHNSYGRDLAWDIEEKIFNSMDRKAGLLGLLVNGLVRIVPLFFLTQSWWVLLAGATMPLCYAAGLIPGLRKYERKAGEFLWPAVIGLALARHLIV